MSGIYGVTRREDLDDRFPVIGKLRKGAAKQANRPGADLEFFRFTSDRDDVVQAFRKVYGDAPASIDVYFPHSTFEAVFHTARELYGQNHLLKEQCDGMYITQWQDGYQMVRGQRLCEKKCKNTESRPPCPDCPLKPIGRLSVILVPLLYEGIVGTVTLETHAWNDLPHIAGQLAKYEPLTGRAFRVYREKTRIGRPDKKSNKRAASEKWLVRIEPTQETAVMLIEDAKNRARAALGVGMQANAPRLEAGQTLTPDMIVETPQLDAAIIDDDSDEYGEVLDEYFEDDAPFQEPPRFTSWKQLKADAIAKLGYKTEDEVTSALKSIFNGDAGSLTFEVAWTALIEHQESRFAEQEPIDVDLTN